MTRSSRVTIADTARVYGRPKFGSQTVVGDWSIVGAQNYYQDIFSNDNERVVRIGPGCIIGSWTLIYEGATLGQGVQVQDRCLVGSLTRVGSRSRVMYAAQVHDKVRIGKNCIVAGFVGDNSCLGDGCSVFGALVHRYEHPGVKDWDRTDECGPSLEENVVVGWGAVVIGPVTIGAGAWIEPNSVVKRDIRRGERYGGK
jgi:UDP-3-O-[3-hydroxymyristoyl] glucosamine N-acyltransferase